MPVKLRKTLGPLFLITLCPPAVMVFWYTNTVLEGSLLAFWEEMKTAGFFSTLYRIWIPYIFGTKTAWSILGIFAATQLLFMRFLPGKTFYGPLTPKGNVPVYKANGIAAYFTTVILFVFCTFVLHLFPATILYDNLGAMLGALSFFSLFFCLFLYFKGRFIPSSTDNGMTVNFIFDYYWGTELYPRVFGFDVKMFTNCRFGMMGWGLLLLSYAAKQKELYGLSDSMVVSVALQFIYLTKFYFWETGYLRSLDIMHDRAGFYICWGCLVWVPCVYTSPTMYLVHHPVHLGAWVTAILLLVGSVSILVNFWADKQRQLFRLSEGMCKIWGKEPKYTIASYTTAEGDLKRNLLLASGWWGIARHFHYIPEIIGALCWSLPALFFHFIPYFYVCFLTILLLDRANRDEQRCFQKYRQAWDQHCEKVPYRILPFIY
jgi:7-dehydrocholesterol reductase